MSVLDSWLNQATRRLSRDSTAQVRAEIQEHFESAREDAVASGATPDEAQRLALAALGDAKTANSQYRHVLLTCAEARLLGEGNWEARIVCSRLWLRWLLLVVPVGFLLVGAGFFAAGALPAARVMLAGGIWMSLLFAAPLLPVYTPARSRIFRRVKWALMLALFFTLFLSFGPQALKMSWLATSCLWPMAWVEWTRVSIRRKLPVARWPKQLYL
jgi:hypothetical protein